jgi:hypothetical protein
MFVSMLTYRAAAVLGTSQPRGYARLSREKRQELRQMVVGRKVLGQQGQQHDDFG